VAPGSTPAAGGDDLASLERSLSGVANELRRMLDRMSDESARRDAILTGMTEGVLVVDQDLRVALCNAALLRALGFRGTIYEGLSLLELVRDSGLYELVRSVVTSDAHNGLS
jgi:two-component system phosphate regulon sensor histidine kinase PhoR